MTEACDLPLFPARRCVPRNPGRRWLVLKFVAFGSAWPLGQADYRTVVSGFLRLRKAVYGRRKVSACIAWAVRAKIPAPSRQGSAGQGRGNLFTVLTSTISPSQ